MPADATRSEQPLSIDRAFVVHFREAEPTASSASGRVEHIVSGASVCFESLEELLRFVARRTPKEPAERR